MVFLSEHHLYSFNKILFKNKFCFIFVIIIILINYKIKINIIKSNLFAKKKKYKTNKTKYLMLTKL